MKDKNISLEEKKKFLSSKMNEEEISEVFSRFNNPSKEAEPVLNTATGRLLQTNRHFEGA
jgi:hypothetical protein